jgi:uncharacterized protein (TIGR02996 family)
MSDAAFLEAICAAPDDDTPRLVYADWLEEHGDRDRAEFIRVQIELARRGECDPSATPLREREYQLLARHEREWLAHLAPWRATWLRNRAEFRRGFVEEVEVCPRKFLRRPDRLFASRPIRWLGLREWVNDTQCARLARLPLLLRLRWLSFSLGRGVMTTGLGRLLASPYLANLEGLVIDIPSARETDWGIGSIRPEQLRRLAESPHLGRLRHLSFIDQGIEDEAAEILASSRAFPALTHLDLRGDGLTDRGAAALAASPHLERLRWLGLEGSGLTAAGRALLRERFGERVSLDVEYWEGQQHPVNEDIPF